MTSAEKLTKYLRLIIFTYLEIEETVSKISTLNRETRKLIQNGAVFYEGKTIGLH